MTTQTEITQKNHHRAVRFFWWFLIGATTVSLIGNIAHAVLHTCASLAISEGANVKVVQKLLGHKSAVLALDRYGHLFPDDLDAVADAFDTAADALRTVGVFKPAVVGTNSP
jgi:integrase